ncbi:MAG: tetratricopeptide repeat protein [Bacteroidetes bacterium]|nr:tetratricopeptide repeat protein [Bacteroidota bacterium]
MSTSPKHNRSFIIPLHALIKYVKGNLLGDKKKEVEINAASSPLHQEALEGLKEFEKIDKVPAMVDDINKAIAIKLGHSISGQSNLTESTKGGSKIIALNTKALAAIGAAASVIVALGFGLFYIVDRSASNSEKFASAPVENTDVVTENVDEKLTPVQDYLAKENATKDTTDSSTSANAIAFEENGIYDLNEDVLFDQSESINGNASGQPPALKFDYSKTKDRNKNEYEAEPVEETRKNIYKNEAFETPELTNKKSEENTYFKPGNNKKANSELSASSTRYRADSTVEYDELADDVESKKQDKSYSSSTQDLANYQSGMALKEKSPTEAIAAFEKVVDNKNSVYYNDAAWQLANLYIANGDDRKAKKLLKRLVKTDKYDKLATELLNKL